MRRLSLALISAVSVLAFTQLASAADLGQPAYKAPPPPPPPPFTWTGFYLGGNIGGAWQSLSNSLSITNDPTDGYFFTGAIPGVNASGSPSFNTSGVTAGGQIGFNYQVSNIVYGLEADFEWLNLKSNNGGAFTYTTNGLNYFLTTSEKTPWLFTARPRIGWAWDRVLLYATGGVAVADIELNQSFGEPNQGVPVQNFPSTTKTQVGWTAGLGAEWAFADNWTVKAEYLYAQFDGVGWTNQFNTPANGNATFSNSTSSLKLNIARVGLNYKF
jgi:outer membrane immunogenic protein